LVSTIQRAIILALLKGHPGYSRIILAGLALHYMSYHPKYCTLLYCISCLLDAVDGQAARALGQTSKFGAVLDMVTDRYEYTSLTSSLARDEYELIGYSRCTTSCLLCYLSSAYPRYALFFQFLISLDFASHYMHMYRQVNPPLSPFHTVLAETFVYLAPSSLGREAIS
jgi:CDP-diacylglycerol--inositol 3-phosphatidyltransferase